MTIESRHPVETHRVGQTLVAGFHRANPPLIWRLDLERNHSFSLALQGDDGEWELGLTSSKGDFTPVARFMQREDAEQAFIKVQRILSRHQNSWIGTAVKIGVGLVILCLLGFGMMVYSYQNTFNKSANALANMGRASMIAPTMDSAPAIEQPPVATTPPKPGVPVSADDFFKNGN